MRGTIWSKRCLPFLISKSYVNKLDCYTLLCYNDNCTLQYNNANLLNMLASVINQITFKVVWLIHVKEGDVIRKNPGNISIGVKQYHQATLAGVYF